MLRPMAVKLATSHAPLLGYSASRHESFKQCRLLSSGFYRTSMLRHSRLFWLIPVAGGLTLYVWHEPSRPPCPFDSPVLIPCRSPKSPSLHTTILSPEEPRQTILSQVLLLLRDRIWDPLRTCFRFTYLFILFLPVLVSSPILLLGKPEKRYRGDRWGAVWWYGLLVRQMEAAGPTFIKVYDCLSFFIVISIFTLATVGSVGGNSCRPILCSALRAFW